MNKLEILAKLTETISDRKINPKDGSYTNLLLSSDNKIVKKLGEENAEFIRAFLKCNDEELAGEAADYLYHMLVALEYRDIKFDAVLDVLNHRYK